MVRKPKVEQSLLLSLWRQGLSDHTIGKMVGMTQSGVKDWRLRNHIPPNRSKRFEGRKSKDDVCGIGYSGNICWLCNNAYGGCSWSRSFLPVEGWTARKVKCDGAETYEITKCRQFVREERMYEKEQ